jgi:hypothetical protein
MGYLRCVCPILTLVVERRAVTSTVFNYRFVTALVVKLGHGVSRFTCLGAWRGTLSHLPIENELRVSFVPVMSFDLGEPLVFIVIEYLRQLSSAADSKLHVWCQRVDIALV